MSLIANLSALLIWLLLCVEITKQQQQAIGLGAVQTNVPWRAGHAAAFLNPYVVLYGGTQQPNAANMTFASGSNDVWIWDSNNGSWYKPTVQVQGGVSMLPQVYIKATTLPSQGQLFVLVSNITATTDGSATGVLQKLDINSWSWSFPTTNFQASARTVGYTMLTINNTVYTYGGVLADSRGFSTSNAMQNTLSLMDANNYQWTSGANGLGLADHTTCYLKVCNCLVTFGGTPTGNPTDVTDSVSLYDLNSKVWNVQGIPSAPGSSSPAARRLHSANCLDNIMVVYGGGTTQPTADSDVWILNATAYPSLVWQKILMENQREGPNLRMGHSAVLDKVSRKIYIFGGWGLSADSNDSNMYILDANKWSWTRVPSTGYASEAAPSSGSGGSNEDSGSNNSNGGKRLGTGAIAGIAVGGGIGLVLIASAVLLLLRRRRQRNKEDIHPDNLSERFTPVNRFADDKEDGGPYSHADAGRQASNDDSDDSDDNYYVVGGGMLRDVQRRGPNRLSKAWTGTQTSLARHSEIGDYSDRIKTGILEAMNDNETVAATHGSHSPRASNSCRASKVLLVSPSEIAHINGQTPNEIVSQKPNEFSIPAARPKQQQLAAGYDVPVEHLTVVPDCNSSRQAVEVPLSFSSLEVAMSSSRPLSATHTSSAINNERQQASPIHYIATDKDSASQPSIACTSTHTWDTSKLPLIHHHQVLYPSSTLNTPTAQIVTPSVTTNNSSRCLGRMNNNNQPPQMALYDTMSPLDALASLGQQQQQPGQFPGTEAKSNGQPNNNSSHNSGSPSDTISSTLPSSSTTTSSNSVFSPGDAKNERLYSQFNALISALPKRYQIDTAKAPLVGLSNAILFATLTSDSTSQRPVVIKVFGRREAWERECRTLVKLKSPHVVELIEVLTIQYQTDAVQNETNDYKRDTGYLTVMERLDETLSEYIQQEKKKKNGSIVISSDDIPVHMRIARDILQCLSWCHERGIAFCDLKPNNIMRSYNREGWKLIDFEGSRTIDEECVGVITPRYCSPEVARATTYGLEGANGVVAMASVDLWSLGCVLYELETTKALFSHNMKDETILHFVSHPSPETPILNNGLRWNDDSELEIPQLEQLVPDTGNKQLIRTLLSRDPYKRATAQQLLRNL